MTAPTVAAPVVDADVSTGAGVSGPISAPMVAALESAWAAIRARHPEVPAVVLVLGAGSIGNAGGLRLGHFAAMRWADPDQMNATDEDAADGADGEPSTGQPVRLPEVFIGGEGLVRGAAVFATRPEGCRTRTGRGLRFGDRPRSLPSRKVLRTRARDHSIPPSVRSARHHRARRVLPRCRLRRAHRGRRGGAAPQAAGLPAVRVHHPGAL